VVRQVNGRSADRAAQLERVADAQLPGQIRIDLAVLDPFDRQRQPLIFGRRGDRVRALRLVAVLRAQPYVDVLTGDVHRPARHLQQIVQARCVSRTTSTTVAIRQTITTGSDGPWKLASAQGWSVE
jgi:hypothetical protein